MKHAIGYIPNCIRFINKSMLAHIIRPDIYFRWGLYLQILSEKSSVRIYQFSRCEIYSRYSSYGTEQMPGHQAALIVQTKCTRKSYLL